ncbi:MAG: SDR family NAD(P)-dependent oxidoreductase [Candidatus Omnitrophica bacterium]|nr:SDR family NAD(P)-dependent oxidoreductase [Candidatus Omnitrophota bacterium]
MSKRVLVTGATGFIGSHIARRLVHEGEEVHIWTRRESDKWRLTDILGKVREHHVNIADSREVKDAIAAIKPNVIHHCATYGACPGQHDVIRSAEVNVMGTINLVEALMNVGGYDCLVNMGSSAEYGIKNKRIKEDDPREVNTAYGATKAGAAMFCEAMARSKGQPILNLKLTSPYGPYDEASRLIPSVITKCLAGEDPKLSKGNESRSFYFIDDLMGLIVKIPHTSWVPGETILAGPDQQYSVRDIATRIIRLTKADVTPLFGALPSRDFDTDYWAIDTGKAKRIFGWETTTSIDEGLSRTIKWYRDYANKMEQVTWKARVEAGKESR